MCVGVSGTGAGNITGTSYLILCYSAPSDSASLSVSQSLCHSASLSVRQSVRLSVHFSVPLPVC